MENIKRYVNEDIYLIISDLLKEYAEIFPTSNQLYKDSVDCGWVVPVNLTDEQYLSNLNKNDLDQYYLEAYEKEDYKMLFDDLLELKNNLNEDHSKIVTIMIMTLKNDISTYPLMITNLFSILDYMFVFQIENGNLKNDKYLNFKNIDSIYKKFEGEGMFNLVYSSCLEVIIKHIEYASFKGDVIFNRHFLQHGRYPFSKIDFSDFIKLVNLCSAFSIFNNFEMFKK